MCQIKQQLEGAVNNYLETAGTCVEREGGGMQGRRSRSSCYIRCGTSTPLLSRLKMLSELGPCEPFRSKANTRAIAG